MAETNLTHLPYLKRILSKGNGMKAADWDATPLGPVASWPEALKLSLGILLYSPLPKLICWGKDLNCIYNNAFRDFLTSHQRGGGLQGLPLKEALPTLYEKSKPSIEKILSKTEINCNHTFEILKDEKTLLPAGTYNVLCNAIFESDDRIGGILLTVRESAPSTDAKETDRQESFPFDAILNMVNVGIAHLSGDDFRVHYVNNVFSELAGMPVSYFLDKTVFELFPGKKDFFIPIIEKVQTTGKAILQGQVPIKFKREGEIVELFLNLIFYPIADKEGIQDSIMVIAVDETEMVHRKNRLREQENIFSNIVSNSRMGFVILKTDRFIVEYANELTLKKTWQLEASKVLGRPLFDIFPELENQKYAQRLRDVYRKGKPLSEKKSHVFINSGKGMQEFYLDYEYLPLFDVSGKINGVSVNFYDVTAEVNEEKEKEEAQQLLEISLDATGLATWEKTFSGKFVHTDALPKIFGLPKSTQLTIEKLTALLHPQDLNLIRKAYETAKETGLYKYDSRFVRPDGGLGYIRVSGKMFFDEGKKPLKIIGTTRDITEEKKNQKSLMRRERRLRQLILQAPVAIGILRGHDYKVEIINESAMNLLGRKENQLLGKPILEVMNEVDTAAAKYLLDKVFHNGETISAKEFPVKILRNKRMEKIYVNFAYDPLRNEQNEVIGVMVVGMEVTQQVIARKKIEASEQQFRLLANSVPHLVWIADKEGHILFTNQTLEDYTGLDIEAFSNKGFVHLVHPEEREKVQEKWNRALKTSTEFIDEHRIEAKDGHYHWYLTRVIPMRNEAEQTQYWIATSTDIQEMKEQDLQKDYFISRASHELKTPVTSLKGYTQILLSIYKDSPENLLATSLNRMEIQINKLTKLIEELLDTSRLNSNELEMNKEKADLVGLLRETIEDLSTAYPDREIQFDSGETIELMLDKNRMSQVINNLLTNAIKYSPKNKPVSVKAAIDGNMVNVSVTDHGTGIEKHFLKNIFDKFFRVSGKQEDTFPGLGIGLYIANEIIKKHDGYIKVVSDLGKGSCFTFSIPVEVPIKS